MKEDPQPQEETSRNSATETIAFAWLSELALLVIGLIVLGAAYTAEKHLVAVLIVVPLAWYGYKKWLQN